MNKEPNQQQEKEEKKKKRRFGAWLWNAFLGLVLLLSLALIFHSQIEGWLVKTFRPELSLEQLAKNKNANASYDWGAVHSLTFQDVLNARNSSNKLNVIGAISMPQIDMNLPIAPGVDNYTLALAAGTLRPDQVMGKGNYPLASHHMISPDALFGPLYYKAKEGQNIYLTDFQHVWLYKAFKPEFIAATDVQVVDDVPGHTYVTLITCDATGDKRLMVRGELQQEWDLKDAPQDAIDGLTKAVKVTS